MSRPPSDDRPERPADAYDRAAPGWAAATSRVYQPLADALVAQSPHPLAGRLVLDAGAGTGCGGIALDAAGARAVSTDLSEGMLRHDRAGRPPAAVCDICRMALRDDAVDDAVVPFVLNHLAEPAVALAEMRRVVRPGGAVLASVFSNASSSPSRDRIDEVAIGFGFVPPPWYEELRDSFAASIGTVGSVASQAGTAGLSAVRISEDVVPTGLTAPGDLVDYRLSMAQYAGWVAGLDPTRRDELWRLSTAAAAEVMTPYAPTVLFLRATA